MTRLSTFAVLLVLSVGALYITMNYLKEQVPDLLKSKRIPFQIKPSPFQPKSPPSKPSTQPTSQIRKMAAEIYKASINTENVPKLRVETSNKNIRIKQHRQRTSAKPRPSIRHTVSPLDFVNVPGKIKIDTCNNMLRNISSRKCIRIHYYNPPQWISPNVLEQCPYPCYMTSGSDFQSAPAVIFHMSSVNKSPPKKTSGQTWIFHSMESPGNSNTDYRHWKRLFNWTYTFRRDSDIMQPFATLHFRDIELDVENYMNSVPLLWQNKSRDAAWFVSRCHVQSSRATYANMLSKHVNLDIFGKCGNLSCPSKEWRDCTTMVNKLYRYYLSLENSLCVDYITEKVYNIFVDMTYVLPIIRGMCNLTMYLPPQSYINTNDFKSVSDLAQFLKPLKDSKKDVNKYFSWWKQFYFTRSGTSGLCDVCKRLHHVQKYQRVYNDIADWMKGSEIYKNKMCRYARDLK